MTGRPGVGIAAAAAAAIAARLESELPGLTAREARRIADRAAADLRAAGWQITAPAARTTTSTPRDQR